MAVQRSSTVAARARAAARSRVAAAQEHRRERERRVAELVDAHAVALAMAQEIQVRADREIAEHHAAADQAVGELFELGEREDAVASLLDLSPPEVRAARRRSRVTKDLSASAAPVGGATVVDAESSGGADGGV